MGLSGDDFSDSLDFHCLFGHDKNIITAAVVVEVIEAVGIGETSLKHF